MSYSCTPRHTWDDYIQLSLLASGYITKAAIVGQQKHQRYAVSKDFNISSSDIKPLLKCFTDPEVLFAEGIRLAGDIYTCVRHDSTVVVGRKHGGGCCIVRTPALMLITVYEDSIHATSCLNLTTRLADYFKMCGY